MPFLPIYNPLKINDKKPPIVQRKKINPLIILFRDKIGFLQNFVKNHYIIDFYQK